ncbi:MAG: diadenylate cyclase CdaA [Thermodesulfobacteriota bacterium]
MTNFLTPFLQLRWLDLLDIALVAFVVYKVLMLVKGTRAMQMLVGLGVVVGTMLAAQQLQLVTIHWLIQSFLASLLLVIVVLFQADIRKALARMGRGPFFSSHEDLTATLEEVVRSTVSLASRMTGALIVLERRIGLADYLDSGVRLEARVSRELLISIFQVTSPLHDGAVIISGNRILAARCVLPLSSSAAAAGRNLGTRHLAGLGIAEETDAVALVVSEERGRVSVAVGDKLTPDLDAVALSSLLLELFQVSGKKRGRLLPRERASA